MSHYQSPPLGVSTSFSPFGNGFSGPASVDVFERAVRLAARSLDAPVALVRLVREGRLVIESVIGLEGAPGTSQEVSPTERLCRRVIAEGTPLMVEDTEEHPLTRQRADVREAGIAGYLGVPLRTVGGSVLGSLCVITREPRAWSREDSDLLEDLGALLSRDLGPRAPADGDEGPRPLVFTPPLVRAALDALDDVFFVVNEAGRVLYWNRRVKDVLGYSDDEVEALTVPDFFAESDRERVVEALWDTIREGHGRVEADVVTSAGEEIPYEIVGSVLVDETGTPIGVCGVGRDVSERRAAEAALRASEARFRSFVEATAQVVWRADESGLVTELSETWAAFTGQTPEEIAGWGWADAVHPEDFPTLGEEWAVHLAARRPYSTEYRVRGRDGAYHRFSVSAVPVFDQHGAFVEWVGTCQDVEEQRRAEEALYESERFLRSTLDALSAHIAVLDAEGTIVAVNEAWRDFARASGTEPDAVGPGVNYLSACERAGAEGSAVADALRAVLAGTRSDFAMEYPCHSPEEQRWFVLRASRFGGEGLARIVVAHEDVTAVRQAREALRESEGRLQLALDSADMGTWDLDIRSGHLVWSPRAAALFGFDEESFDGQVESVLGRIHEEDLDRLFAAGEAAATEGHDLDVEYRVCLPSGEVHWARATGHTIYGEAGEPVRMIGTVLDVTDRKRAEEETARAMAESEAARVAAEAAARTKSALLTNMSHEIRTPLTGIIGFADVLADEVDDDHREFVLLLRENGRRLLDTLNSVLDLAQIEAGHRPVSLAELDLGAAVADAVSLFRLQAEQRGLDLECRVPDEPLLILADAAAVMRVVTNLVSNALKFTERGGVTVSVRTDGANAELCVADTGVGIAAAFRENIFEAFRQESEGEARSYEGSGLGLSITKRLVELMGGTISVESEKGRGSTFTVLFPRAGGSPA